MTDRLKSLLDGEVLRKGESDLAPSVPSIPASAPSASRPSLPSTPSTALPRHDHVRKPRRRDPTDPSGGPARKLFEGPIVKRAIGDAFRKLDPRHQFRNPVMFVVEVGSIFTSGLFLQAMLGHGEAPAGFILAVSLWLWFTVLFANFAEAMAEGRGKAQADSLRKARRDVQTKKLAEGNHGGARSVVASSELRKGDFFLVEAGDDIAVDGEIVEGVASVNEAAITGESAPVIRESGGDRSAVTGGTQVLSDWIVVRVTAEPGHTFLDRMIAMVEGAKRKKTPNEIALDILLAAMTIIFLLATVTLLPFSLFAVKQAGLGQPVTITVAASFCMAAADSPV